MYIKEGEGSSKELRIFWMNPYEIDLIIGILRRIKKLTGKIKSMRDLEQYQFQITFEEKW